MENGTPMNEKEKEGVSIFDLMKRLLQNSDFVPLRLDGTHQHLRESTVVTSMDRPRNVCPPYPI